MRFRLKAFGLHLLASACALSLILGGLYLGWYRWPGWYLTAVARILLIVCSVDLALGPTLTLIIANPKKPRRILARDIAMIAAVQLVALGYGTVTLWLGRPLYYTFSANRLETVQASDLEPPQIALASKENPAFAPHWYSLPRWVWAPLPDDPDKAMAIVNGATLGEGQDIIDMPRYFKPWDAGLPALRDRLSSLSEIKYFSKPEQKALRERMQRLSLDPTERNALVMWGGTSRRLLAVFEVKSLKIRALIKPD
ncbi:MAG TPA: hypothetical protein VLV29_01790 [Steroidobacteraceae bacterium]|nr:hypothetical protein [Steroidobacteraceae bacterium]